MRRSSTSLFRLLLLVVLGIVLSGLAITASAAPQAPAGDPCYVPPSKIASPASDRSKTTLREPILCCSSPFPFKISSSRRTIKATPAAVLPPCEPECTVLLGKRDFANAYKGQSAGKMQSSLKDSRFLLPPPPCPPEEPPPANLCGIGYTSDAVVGSLPFDQQAYWAPGKEASGVTVSAGTYWVNGIGTAEDGGEYYEIVVSCQYLFVPVASMQPNYETPWNGEALPTTEIS